MIDQFTEDVRRDPYPLYARYRAESPILHDPRSGLYLVFDYEGVKRTLSDHDAFSSRYGVDWLVFTDPPRHGKLRRLISKAFTPASITGLESSIRDLSRTLLDDAMTTGEMDLAESFAVPLPMLVIGSMLGVPPSDRDRFKRWNDAMVNMSLTIGRRDAVAAAAQDAFIAATAEMKTYVVDQLERRRADPTDDLLTRLAAAEVDGERLTPDEILSFFQLLLLAGSETTTNLIDSAILCLIENPKELARLRASPELLPALIEEVLRYRSPVQWMYRVARRDVEMSGQVIPAGKLVLTMIGSANRDPRQFPNPDQFDITRTPNAHIAFGQGIHFCLGAPLARLEATIALTDLLARMTHFERATDEPWEPRAGPHVHGPTRLPIRFKPAH
jgi:cytochrome P450